MACCGAVAFCVLVFIIIETVSGYDPVETITVVEATSNSLIVHTDTAGGTAGLRILIEIYDLAANEQQLTTLDLSGPALENTRGKYSLLNLKPNSWYGVSFKTEQTTGGSTRAAIDNRLERTLTANGTEDYPLFQIYIVANNTNGDRVGELQLTVKRAPSDVDIELIVSAWLECDNAQSNKQDIKLSGNQTKATAHFQASYTPEIAAANDGSSRVTAVLTPTTCDQLCWSPWLRFTTTKNVRTYANKENETCRPIETVNITSGLRRVIGHTATDESVTVTTVYNVTGNPERDAMVVMSAYQLTTAQNTTPVRAEWLVKNFTVDWTSENFTIDDLTPGQWYAIRYNYTKHTPFIYNDVLRIVAFTQSNDSVADKALSTALKIGGDQLNMTVARSQQLVGHRVTAQFLPFCGQNGTSLVLTDEQPQQQVDFDIHLARCLLFPDKCNGSANDSEVLSALDPDDYNSTMHSCEHLCYQCEMAAPSADQQRQTQQDDMFTLDKHCFAMRDVFIRSHATDSHAFNIVLFVSFLFFGLN